MFRNEFPFYLHMMAEEGGGDSGSVAAESGASEAPSDSGIQSGGTGDVGDSAAPAPEASSEGYWPSDWRDQITGGDEKLAKLAGRYATPKEAFNALVHAQNRIRSGEVKSALPENPSEEQLNTWRQENGIPEAPDKYDLTFDDGLVIGEQDKPIVDSFLQKAHEQNMPPETVKDVVAWWYDQQQQQIEQRMEYDIQMRDSTMDELNAEWGGEYRGNINRIESLIGRFPQSVQDAFKEARAPDGSFLLNNPDVLRGMVNISYEADPAGAIVPAGVGDPAKNIDQRIDEINQFMRTNRTEYFKNEKMQKELRDLLQAKESLDRKAS